MAGEAGGGRQGGISGVRSLDCSRATGGVSAGGRTARGGAGGRNRPPDAPLPGRLHGIQCGAAVWMGRSDCPEDTGNSLPKRRGR